ncbi:MAG: hypothetical protein Kow0025_25550 [Thermodesulfovibrionales bacterium]
MGLRDDGHCFACGRLNPAGLGLSFRAGGGESTADFTPRREHQGYAGVAHGGIISAIIDEAMVKAAASAGVPAPVTAELSVRFKRPARVGEGLVVEARVEEASGRVVSASATVRRAADGEVLATGRGKLISHE